MVTLFDVARLAGVSTATVSRVVHGQDRVRESTRLRVKLAIEELGYVPDGAAQSLSRRRKDVIGLVCVERELHHYEVEHLNLLYYDDVLRGVEARIRSTPWSLLITFVNGAADPDFPRLEALTGKVDGLLIGEGMLPSPLIERLAARVPLVVIAGTPQDRAADVLTADNRAGAAALVTHLIEVHGTRRLFYVDGPANAPDASERRLGFQDVLRAHRGTVLVGSAPGNHSVQAGLLAGEKLLAGPRDELPDAVVCSNDQTAIGVLTTLTRAGVRIPRDVAITGFDDIFPGSVCDPPLTTVHQSMRLLGERACDRLLDRIAAPDMEPAADLLPVELVIRSSCGCPPGTTTRLPAGSVRRLPWLSSCAASPSTSLRRGWPSP